MEGSDRLLRLLQEGLAAPLAPLTGEPSVAAVIAEQVVREVAQAVRRDAQGRAYAPDQFTISFNTVDARTLAGNSPGVQDALARALHTALSESGHTLARYPHVTLSSDPTLAIGAARVIVWHSRDPLSVAAAFEGPNDEPPTPPAVGAFLIVDGKRHFRLDRPLIHIGRKLDNHLVLADPHVSRRHAEVRLQGERYMLRDLNSTAGTRVNGQLVTEHLLQPGDVIGISGITLIYNEDPGGPPGATVRYTPPSMGRKDPNQVTPLDLRRPEADKTRPADDRSGEAAPG